jgi:hypothetical protein
MGRKKNGKVEYDDGGSKAGASINKTLNDIEALLSGGELTPHYNSNMRAELRAKLLEAFETVGKSWYRKGFNRGHREAFEQAVAEGSVPRVLKTTKSRSLTASSKKRDIKLTSVIRNKS